MEEILYDNIPSLDLATFTSGDQNKKDQFVSDLGTAFHNIGFVGVRNHFLSADLQAKLYSATLKFFSLPDSAKRSYERPHLSGQRGYIAKGKEHAKGRNTGDLKEFFHIGQELSSEQLNAEGYPENVWPDEVPELRTAAMEAYHALEKTGEVLLRAISLYLGLPENYFDDKIKKGNSILRPIHYYAIEDPQAVPADAVRAAEHGDINLITLLMGASAEGLQVLRRDGKWIPVTALPDQLVVNVGDMLERLTNQVLKSTIHRVVNPPRHLMNTPRFSIPFFMHPRSEMSLAALPGCVDFQNPQRWDDIRAGEFLDQRLAEIGLKK
jgi:isopenicillin N synthase-like dioxygenase